MFLLYISIVITVFVCLYIAYYGLKVSRALDLEKQDSQDKVAKKPTVAKKKKEEPIDISEDALRALMKLGYKKKESIEALRKATKVTKSSDASILVRAALEHL